MCVGVKDPDTGFRVPGSPNAGDGRSPSQACPRGPVQLVGPAAGNGGQRSPGRRGTWVRGAPTYTQSTGPEDAPTPGDPSRADGGALLSKRVPARGRYE